MSSHILGFEDNEKKDIEPFFEFAADIDFWHDFNHADKMDFKFFNILATSLPQTKEYKTVFEHFKKEAIDKTPWGFFSEAVHIKTILPTVADFIGRTTQDEDDIIDTIWKGQYSNVNSSLKFYKNHLKQTFHDSNFVQANKLTADITNIQIKIAPSEPQKIDNSREKFFRDYTLTSYPVQIQGTSVSGIVSLSEVVGEGITNFILLIDVTYLSFKRIRKQFLDTIGTKYQSTQTYNIYIISSVENDSDPATKITSTEWNINKTDQDDGCNNLYKNINVFFLKEEKTYSSTYYKWDQEKGNTSLLYSDPSIKTIRTDDGLIRAEVTLEDGTTIVHKDLGTISEIAAASKAMCRKYMDYTLDKTIQNKQQEISHYYLLKRAGDWCQALCLLDRDRKYRIIKEEKQKQTLSEILSINELSTMHNGNIEIGLMTHDRVLLTYALQLGLNVFFTIKLQSTVSSSETKKGNTMMLLYFKNEASNIQQKPFENLRNKMNELISVLKKGNTSPSNLITENLNTNNYLSIMNPKLNEIQNEMAKLDDNDSIKKSIIEKLQTKLDTNKHHFINNLEMYIKNLRKLLFLGSRIDTGHIENPVLPIEKTQIALSNYIYNCMQYIRIIQSNSDIHMNLDNLDNVGIINWDKEEKIIKEMVDVIKKQTNFKRDVEDTSSTSVVWNNFQSLTLKNIQSDYITITKKYVLSSILPEQPPEVTGRSRQNGPGAFYIELNLLFSNTNQKGGGTDDEYIEMKKKQTIIYTTPLHIPVGDLTDTYLIDAINYEYGNNNKAITAAQIVFEEKKYQMREPNLTDFCKNVVNKYMSANPSSKNPQQLQKAVKELIDTENVLLDNSEGEYTKNDKMYMERGLKIIDIAENYNTVVDDYIIDYNNADMFRYFFEKSGIKLNPNNLSFLYYRFIVYYLDRLSSKLENYQNMTNLDESYEPSIRFIELEILNLSNILSNTPNISDLKNIMFVFFNKYMEEAKQNTLREDSKQIYGNMTSRNNTEEEEHTYYKNFIIQLSRDIKRLMLVTICKYYDATGVKDLNSQLLEGFIYNLCVELQDVIDLYTVAKFIPNTYKDKLFDAINVVFIIFSIDKNKQNIVRTVIPGSNIQQTLLQTKPHIYYARAIRFMMNKNPDNKLIQNLLTAGSPYISNADISVIQNTEDKKNITIMKMYYIALTTPQIDISILEEALPIISTNNVVQWHSRIEILANLISLYYMVHKNPQELSKFLILIPSADEHKDNFEDLFNNYLEDMDVPLRYFYPEISSGP